MHFYVRWGHVILSVRASVGVGWSVPRVYTLVDLSSPVQGCVEPSKYQALLCYTLVDLSSPVQGCVEPSKYQALLWPSVRRAASAVDRVRAVLSHAPTRALAGVSRMHSIFCRRVRAGHSSTVAGTAFHTAGAGAGAAGGCSCCLVLVIDRAMGSFLRGGGGKPRAPSPWARTSGGSRNLAGAAPSKVQPGKVSPFVPQRGSCTILVCVENRQWQLSVVRPSPRLASAAAAAARTRRRRSLARRLAPRLAADVHCACPTTRGVACAALRAALRALLR